MGHDMQDDDAASAAARRKIRKGTHSCWECRRRKIGCRFDTSSSSICVGCRARGSACLSQEHVPETKPPTSDRRLSQRISRIEAMLGRFVDEKLSDSSGLSRQPPFTPNTANTPAPATALPPRQHAPPRREQQQKHQKQRRQHRQTRLPSPMGTRGADKDSHVQPSFKLPTPSESSASPVATTHMPTPECLHQDQASDLLERSAVANAHNLTHFGPGGPPFQLKRLLSQHSTPGSSPHSSRPANDADQFGSPAAATAAAASPWAVRHAQISRHLRALFPPASVLAVLSSQQGVARNILEIFYTPQDVLDQKPEPASALATAPDPITTHPSVMARRLVQLAMCLQYYEGFDSRSRATIASDLGCSPHKAVHTWASAVGMLIASNDMLVGCTEGLECLILLAMCLSEAGHLRKAWMHTRRALSMAQLLGVDRSRLSPLGTNAPIRSVDPSTSPSRLASPLTVWYAINALDRCLSLPLGLPIGSRDESFMDPAIMAADSPETRLNKMYVVISRRLADRNDTALGMRATMAQFGAVTSDTIANCDAAYALTQQVDVELERAAKMMEELWWQGWRLPLETSPSLSLSQSPASRGVALPRSGVNERMHTPSDTRFDDADVDVVRPRKCVIKLQIQHYSLVLLTHLPFMLLTQSDPSETPLAQPHPQQHGSCCSLPTAGVGVPGGINGTRGIFDPPLPFIARPLSSQRYAYNRAACLRASRSILERFLEIRRVFLSPVSSRLTDYMALIAGMTILLGYHHCARTKAAAMAAAVAGSWTGWTEGMIADIWGQYDTEKEKDKKRDRELVEAAVVIMRDMGEMHGDRLSKESAEVLTELMPAIREGAGGGGGGGGDEGDEVIQQPSTSEVHMQPQHAGDSFRAGDSTDTWPLNSTASNIPNPQSRSQAVPCDRSATVPSERQQQAFAHAFSNFLSLPSSMSPFTAAAAISGDPAQNSETSAGGTVPSVVTNPGFGLGGLDGAGWLDPPGMEWPDLMNENSWAVGGFMS